MIEPRLKREVVKFQTGSSHIGSITGPRSE